MPPGVKWILIGTASCFLVQLLFDRGGPFSHGWVTDLFALWPKDVRKGYLWQVVTYMLLHSNTFIWHIVLNMLTLFFIGPETERTMGTRHFLIMYLLSGVLGGISYVITVPSGVPLVGASGAVFGVLGAMAALYPNRLITLLVFFVFPVTLRIWVLAVGLMGIQLMAILMQTGGNVAYGVHIAGGVIGYTYTVMVFRPDLVQRWQHRWRMKGKISMVPGTRAEMAEVDRVLDKVASEGINSLSRKERAILEKASEARRRK